ncbi:MAG: hypothetical protein Q8K30_05260 [Candidatus Gracilibacteria bacterium]|nr:hypothetical protein [Candidatus Gracilibacteria bacterium]
MIILIENMTGNIYKKKVLITVKTYPTLSSKYDELVCTAGITEEGEWIRIYPMPFRKFEDYNKYKKYDWIEMELLKNPIDYRPESFRPYHTPAKLTILNHISTADKWKERKSIVLKNVYNDLSLLISENKDDKGTSLVVFKPTKILDFTYEEVERVWDYKKLKIIEERTKQTSLIDDIDETFKVVNKLPYKFRYKFEDINGKVSNMMIEDWEIGQLYWNCFYTYKDEKVALEKVKEKYFDDFAKTKDLHFFLGTTKEHNKRAKNPFVIIGTFHPPKDERISLF